MIDYSDDTEILVLAAKNGDVFAYTGVYTSMNPDFKGRWDPLKEAIPIRTLGMVVALPKDYLSSDGWQVSVYYKESL